jgi:hypothetical protein
MAFVRQFLSHQGLQGSRGRLPSAHPKTNVFGFAVSVPLSAGLKAGQKVLKTKFWLIADPAFSGTESSIQKLVVSGWALSK